MEKNNKNNNCIIVANVVLLITISLFIYKVYLIKSYSISKYEYRYNKFTDLVLASLPAGAGDSGAIVMEQTATFNVGFKTAGIAKAVQNNSTAMVFVKATRINSDFGLSRY